MSNEEVSPVRGASWVLGAGCRHQVSSLQTCFLPPHAVPPPLSQHPCSTQRDLLGSARAAAPPVRETSLTLGKLYPQQLCPLPYDSSQMHQPCHLPALKCGERYGNFSNSFRNLLGSSPWVLPPAPAAKSLRHVSCLAAWADGPGLLSNQLMASCSFCTLFLAPSPAGSLAHSRSLIQSCRTELRLK